MRFALLFCLLIFCGCHCRTLTRTVNGLKQPKTESKQSITKWLDRTGLTGYEVVTVAPESFIDATFFYMLRKLVFNKNGKVAELGSNKTGVVCHIKTPGEIQNLKPDFPEFTEFLISFHRDKEGEYSDTTYYELDSLNTYIHTLDGTKTQIELSGKSDYLVVIPFSIYEGRTLQVHDIRKYLRAVKANPYSTFKVILLNLDKQQWWGEKWNNAIKIST